MVVCSNDRSIQLDILFVIEGTAVNGAYMNDLKTSYIIPSLEYFNQGNISIDEVNCVTENTNALYGIVVYQAADCLPHPCSDTLGPFTDPSTVLTALETLELIGGKGESCANIAEGLAAALQCFEELQQKREPNSNVQKHCILICNSPPYLMPVMECQNYSGKTVDQLAAILQENNINLSIISPKKIPALYKLFEKAGGDLSVSQAKNYAKDPRHLVLLKGYHLKERPPSPPIGSNPNALPQTSMSSPLSSNDGQLASGTQGASQSYRPTTSLNTLSQQISNSNMAMASNRGMMQQQQQQQQQQLPVASSYMTNANRPQRWGMVSPQTYIPQKSINTSQSSALIAQLTQPPSTVTAGSLNQYGHMGSNSPMSSSQQQQQQSMMNMMSNQQTSVQNAMQQQVSNSPQQNQVVASQSQPTAQTLQTRERRTIWQGLLEWVEKPHSSLDQKITKHVPCQVSANSKDGEPELNADSWPQKLIMQLMAKPLIVSIGGAYLKNSKSVLFNLQNCEALESLTKLMSSGFAGCVHFQSSGSTSCDIKLMVLLYTPERKAFLGFIPNDQVAFVDRLRKVIQQQKTNLALYKSHGGGGSSSTVMQQGSPGVHSPQDVAQQQQQQQSGLVMPQTNAMAMAGGQITQNIVTPSASSAVMGAMMNQNVMQNTMRMQNMQQGMGQPQQQNMMGGSMQRNPYETPFQLQVERQQNLEKINQLKQTLEAAQQQEQQYKSQLERISHLKTSQLQEALQVAQQQELQYQRMANQGNPMGAPSQQRMARPMMSNNPGLRHLLQQQPQYRQMMGMQGMGGNLQRPPQMGQQMQNPGGNPQNTFDDVNNFDFM